MKLRVGFAKRGAMGRARPAAPGGAVQDVGPPPTEATAAPPSRARYRITKPLPRQNRVPARLFCKHMAKDLKFVVDTALTPPAPAPGACRSPHLFIRAKGLGGRNFAAVLKVSRNMV